MYYVLICAFMVVAAAPFIGIWRGHVWAKAHGKVRATVASEVKQIA